MFKLQEACLDLLLDNMYYWLELCERYYLCGNQRIDGSRRVSFQNILCSCFRWDRSQIVFFLQSKTPINNKTVFQQFN